MSRLEKLRTIIKLGPDNIARVGCYKLGIRSGFHPCQRISAAVPEAPFFTMQSHGVNDLGLEAREDWKDGYLQYFGKTIVSPSGIGKPPGWLAPEGRSNGAAAEMAHWWTIPDFDPSIGDIKRVWELSRFDWIIPMAQRVSLGDAAELERINDWLASWVSTNPPYRGRNWKCGQEASIRLMNLVMASLLLGGRDSATESLRALIRLHLQRIAPSIAYAIGQSNNHGTSEAAALYIGGSWLGGKQGARWYKMGKRLLENRSSKLIECDGTFSQYSVNYHRLMLDTYSFCETWRRYADIPPMSNPHYEKMVAATNWLEQMVMPIGGDTPNIGANDGAQILNLTRCGYRDFRASVQWASVLFKELRAYPPGPWDQQMKWLQIALPKKMVTQLASTSMDKGGFHVLRSGSSVAYMRYPRYRFRPSQADALHCDLWAGACNLLRDAGSYSYNVSEEDTRYFNGTRAHNTIEFDNRDQMPRYGRFLFGEWLVSSDVVGVTENGGEVSAQAGYRDYRGAIHFRKLSLTSKCLVVEDIVEGFESKAVLRWRLLPGDWSVDGQSIRSKSCSVVITANMPIRSLELTTGFESIYYLEKHSVPVLEVEVDKPGLLTTTVKFEV